MLLQFQFRHEDLKAEIRDLVSLLRQEVPLTGLQRALEGHNSLPTQADFDCKTFLEVLLLMPDVLKVSRSPDGSFIMIQLRREGETEQEEEEEEVTWVLAEFSGGVRGGDGHHLVLLTRLQRLQHSPARHQD